MPQRRAAIRMRMPEVAPDAVPVAAIWWRAAPAFLGAGPLRGAEPARSRCGGSRGAHMGWFEHGSTIILFAPTGFALHETVGEGAKIRAGSPLLRKVP